MTNGPEYPNTTLVFYGSTMTASSLETAFRASAEWMERKGYPPTRVGRTRMGEKGGDMTFGRGYPKILREGFAGLKYLTISRDSPVDGSYDGGVSFVNSPDYDIARATFRGTEFRFQPELVADLASSLCGALRPEYGFGHHLSNRRSPDLYAVGLRCGSWGMGRENMWEYVRDANDRDLWSFAGMDLRRFREGYLRDVYPWNFLTSPMLARRVDGVPLAEWIAAGEGRGTLRPWTGDSTLWEVPEQDIPAVRTRLQDSDAILTCLNPDRILKRNYLLGKHLYRGVGKGEERLVLQDWIASAKGRGRLVLLAAVGNNELWVWELDESEIPAVQAELQAKDFNLDERTFWLY